MKNAKLYVFMTKLYTIFYFPKLPKFTTLQPIFGSFIMVLEHKLCQVKKLL